MRCYPTLDIFTRNFSDKSGIVSEGRKERSNFGVDDREGGRNFLFTSRRVTRARSLLTDDEVVSAPRTDPESPVLVPASPRGDVLSKSPADIDTVMLTLMPQQTQMTCHCLRYRNTRK